MNLLSIEAAASPASVALTLGDTIVERLCEDPRAQAEHLLGLIEGLLAENEVSLDELDGVAVGRGPGSFTGLRVAAALAQGLAYAAQKPVANVSSLAATAHRVFAEYLGADNAATPQNTVPSGALLVCLDARKTQVYCALYEAGELGRPRLVSPETVLDPTEVVAQFKGKATWGAGGGFAEYAELDGLGLTVVKDIQPSARAVAIRAASGAVSFEAPYLATPVYVRDNVTHGS